MSNIDRKICRKENLDDDKITLDIGWITIDDSRLCDWLYFMFFIYNQSTVTSLSNPLRGTLNFKGFHPKSWEFNIQKSFYQLTPQDKYKLIIKSIIIDERCIKDKNMALNLLRSNWKKIVEYDNRWLSKHNQEKCHWAYQYLQKKIRSKANDMTKITPLAPFLVPYPSKKKDYYQACCLFLDALPYGLTEKILLTQRLRKSWSQYKADKRKREEKIKIRANDLRDDANLVISREVLEKIHLLSKANKSTPEKILTKIVNKSYREYCEANKPKRAKMMTMKGNDTSTN